MNVYTGFQDAWHCEICSRKPGRGFGMHTYALSFLVLLYISVGFWNGCLPSFTFDISFADESPALNSVMLICCFC